MSDQPTRRSHWLAVMREPGWKYFVALPFTLFTAFAAIRDEILPAEVAEKWKLPALIEDHLPTFLPAMPWYVWALITAVVFIVLIFDGSYRVATKEADEKATLAARLNSLEYARAQLELVFDESDPRCVKDDFYWYKDKTPKSRTWFVGIKNSSTTKSADDVTIRAQESWFVENTISIAARYSNIEESPKKNPLIFSRTTLEPGAVEFIMLFGLSPNPSDLPGDVFKRSHEFVLEARARDAQTVLMTLKYEPTEPFATIKRV
jgi:hypothetical protein